MYKRLRVKLNERVVIFKNGLPKCAYGPGRHLIWGFDITEQRFRLEQLVFHALPEVLEVMPEEWYAEVTLGDLERGVLYRDGAPAVYLGTGRHLYFRLDPSVHLLRFDVRERPPELTKELREVLPGGVVLESFVAEHERGLVYRSGQLQEVLPPGRHSYWLRPEEPISIRRVDTRLKLLTLSQQELMTRDKVTLRLSLSLEYAIVDVAKAARAVEEPTDVLYLMAQLAAREFLAGVTLDELLEGRGAFTEYLETRVREKAPELGVRVGQVGLKDVILPGEMKALMNRVIEAEKAAAASVIERREKAATTRVMASSARIMADNPVLIRLEELEAMKEIAASVGKLEVAVGKDELAALLRPQRALVERSSPS